MVAKLGRHKTLPLPRIIEMILLTLNFEQKEVVPDMVMALSAKQNSPHFWGSKLNLSEEKNYV
ncbi:MAG: hypothetical protein B5M51_01360 [Anaerolinea sp. 4484_236]|nr:MAG: hypothetical protein B5M51_01360 [Anaerolinea sp. 4484_236]